MNKIFLEYNKERLSDLAKLAGKDRENYLINLVNELTKEIHFYKDKIEKIENDNLIDTL